MKKIKFLIKLKKLDCKDMIKKAENFIIECKSIIKQFNEKKVLQLRQELKGILEQ